MNSETQLWTWLLFGGQLPVQRAKALLARWDAEGRTLSEIFSQLPNNIASLELTPDEARTLHQPPATFSAPPALRWHEPLYPSGLQQLPEKLRPALLFYRGQLALLSQPIIYLPPAPLNDTEQEIAHEVASLLLDENILPAALHKSEQAAVLLEEMTYTEGKSLLFLRQGITTVTLSELESAFLDAGRLLIVSPLPPDASPNPAWDRALEAVEFAAAHRCILTTPGQLQTLPQQGRGDTLLIGEIPDESQQQASSVQSKALPTDILLWLAAQTTAAPAPTAPPSPAPPSEPEPPLRPEDVLRTLEKGGAVPDVLKARLLGKKDS